jgi:very-short-patch-repair endonuclease
LQIFIAIKLIIELDGRIHDLPEIGENDERRQKELELSGYTIIRFTNEQVMKQVEKVIKEIQTIIVDSNK